MEENAAGGGPDGPGAGAPPPVEVLVVDDPTAEAPALADARGAEVVADEGTARAVVEARRAAPPPAVVDEEGIAELRRLADELARARRVRTRTEESFREVMAQRLAQSAGVTVHPTSIRETAAAILQAERELAAAEAHLADPTSQLPGHPPPNDGRDQGPLPSLFDERGIESRRMRRAGVALAAGAVVVAAVLAAAGVAVGIAVAVGVVGAAAALLGSRRMARAVEARTPPTEPAPEPPPLSDLAEPTALDEVHRRTVELDRSRANERLRAATRQWETLVGPGFDPHDVEGVLRARDAQFDLAAATAASPTIRAVSAVHRRSSARWRVAWAILGYDGPPSEARLEAELERLRSGAPRPVLLVEPKRWLGSGELTALLRELPTGTTVTIVERRA